MLGKRLELLREVVPRLGRLAIMGDVGNPQVELQMGEVQAAARTLGLKVAPLEIRRAEDLSCLRSAQGPSGGTLRRGRCSPPAPTAIASSRLRSAHGCLLSGLPAIMSKPGGLMSYGPNFPALFEVPPVAREHFVWDKAR